MKRKSVLPFAAVLAIAAVWTVFTRSGKNPPSGNMNPLGKSSTQTTVSVEAPLAQDQREEKIAALFQNEDRFAASIQVHAIQCQENSCTVEAFAPGDPSQLRGAIEDLVRAHPWLGAWDMKTETENPGIVTLVFHSQSP